MRRRHAPPVITDAEPAQDDQLRARRRTYTLLMVVHIAGFATAGVLYEYRWLAASIVLATGALPWVAVVLANDRPARTKRMVVRPGPRDEGHHAPIAPTGSSRRWIPGPGGDDRNGR